MSKYTDIMVYTETKAILRKLADEKNISLAQLLALLAERLQEQMAKGESNE